MNSFDNKSLKMAFYFEKKTVPDKRCVLCNNNKQNLRSIIEQYEVIFVKTYILLWTIIYCIILTSGG